MPDSYLKSLLGDNEQIQYTTRQHWLVLAGEILSESVLSLALIILVSVIWGVWMRDQPLIALAYLLLLFPLISLLRDVLSWFNRKYVVTNRRVIHVTGVLNKNTTDSSLEKVNDVKMEQTFWGRMFGYGDVEILTASELGVNLFKHIANPIRLKTAMLNAKEQLEQGRGAPKRPPGDIPALIARLDDLRKQGALTEEEFQKKKADLLSQL
jgi:uncharacterized membrane protein YdbT with pleckstrin-like domain